jgi:adenylate cyclase class 2
MSATKPLETEVKIHVDDLSIVAYRLKMAGAALVAPRVYERNIRYDDAEGSFAASERVLRLRQDSRARLTFKDAGTSDARGILSRPEYEVEVSDFAAMQAILQRLGYQEMWVYEKYRTTYELDGGEVVLDEMPYGSFVEIEGEPDKIELLLQLLGLSDSPRIAKSYSAIFFQLKQALSLPFRDLTFDNFNGIHVPPDLLRTLE